MVSLTIAQEVSTKQHTETRGGRQSFTRSLTHDPYKAFFFWCALHDLIRRVCCYWSQLYRNFHSNWTKFHLFFSHKQRHSPSFPLFKFLESSQFSQLVFLDKTFFFFENQYISETIFPIMHTAGPASLDEQC